jgi:hypothetical protein
MLCQGMGQSQDSDDVSASIRVSVDDWATVSEIMCTQQQSFGETLQYDAEIPIPVGFRCVIQFSIGFKVC